MLSSYAAPGHSTATVGDAMAVPGAASTISGNEPVTDQGTATAGDAIAVPGAASTSGYAREANGFGEAGAFSAPPGALGRGAPEFAEFEDIYAQARPGRPPGFAPARAGAPPPLTGFLHVRPDLCLPDKVACGADGHSTCRSAALAADMGSPFDLSTVGLLLHSC